MNILSLSLYDLYLCFHTSYYLGRPRLTHLTAPDSQTESGELCQISQNQEK
jgi:hypothetical protein